MRRLFRIFSILAFLGLAALAAWPYLPTLRQDVADFYAAWQSIRAARNDADTPGNRPLEEPANPARRRPILVPSTTEPELAAEAPAPQDPFLAEARRRAREDPEAAMDWIQNQAAGAERLRGMLEVVALWAADDSENALLWLESNAQGLARLDTLNSGMELWAKQDPVAAADWIDGMANDGSKVAAVKALAANWATSNPAEASRWVSQLPAGALRDEAGHALIESWAATDPEAASIWALSQAEFNGNSKLLNLSIEKYVDTDPDGAETFLRGLTEAYDAPEAIETYIRARAKNNPQDAMNLLAALEPDDPINLTENPRIIMEEWSRTDSVAASAWLSEATPGPQRDTAIIGFTNTMLDFEPEAATAWANSISNPETRLEYLNKSISTWSRTDPTAALDWVKSADLAPALRQSLATEIGAE